MKKALLIAAAVMFVAVSAFAELPPKAYIGLYTGATHDVNTACPGLYAGFPCWIWVLPATTGLQAAEFAIQYPPTVINLATVKNPGITVELGALTTGISVAFGEGMCQADWVWIYQLTLMAVGPITQVKVDVIPHPGTLPVPAIQLATCELGYPIEPMTYVTPLYLCWTPDPGPLGVQESNWGAIKSLF
jgi:hypothetical protein